MPLMPNLSGSRPRAIGLQNGKRPTGEKVVKNLLDYGLPFIGKSAEKTTRSHVIADTTQWCS